MSTTTSLASVAHLRPAGPAVHPVVRARKLHAAIVTSIAVALTLVLTIAFGGFGLFSAAASMWFPLALTWAASDVLRADEVRS